MSPGIATTTPPPFAGALRTAEELADVLDHVPSVVAYWDRDLRNRFANWAALDWLGKYPDELLGRHIRTALGAPLYAGNRARIERALAGEPQSFERTIGSRQALIDYTPYAVGGEPAGFFTLVTDISAQAAVEVSRRQIGGQLALIAERERVAAGMEEAVIGRLGDAAAQLDTSDAFSPPVRDLVAAAAQLVTASLSQLRAALHDPGPTGEPLSAAVRDVLDTAARGLGFAPALTVDGALQEITPVVGAEIVAMLIEALSNVSRHAHATGAHVAIRVAAGEVVVTVTDDGRGIERPERHSGLANMQSRAARFGGTCTWRANRPNGTVVEWRAPVDRRSPRPAAPLAPWQHRRATDPKPPEPPSLAVPEPDRRPASLALSAAQLVDVLDHIPAAVSAWDSALRNQFANRAAVEWLGRSDRAELLGRPLGELLAQDVYEANLPAARAALDGTPQLVERTAPDGRHLRVGYSARVVDGAVRGVYVQLIDVTARTEAEERLRDTNEQISVLRERQRIAEDLHDVVIQHLFAAGLKLDAARGSGSAADLARIDAVTATVDGAINDLRASIVSLRASEPAQPNSSSG